MAVARKPSTTGSSLVGRDDVADISRPVSRKALRLAVARWPQITVAHAKRIALVSQTERNDVFMVVPHVRCRMAKVEVAPDAVSNCWVDWLSARTLEALLDANQVASLVVHVLGDTARRVDSLC